MHLRGRRLLLLGILPFGTTAAWAGLPTAGPSNTKKIVVTTTTPSLWTARGGGRLGPHSRRHATTTTNNNEPLLSDYRPQAAALFGNIRIPAALFAGASAGAAFAMPILSQDTLLKTGVVKRIYALLLLSALSSEIVAVVVSTLAVGTLSTSSSSSNNSSSEDEERFWTTSVSELLKTQFALEWVAARFHFLTGVLSFMMGIGLRAWLTIACPVIAKAALGIIMSSTFLCLAFIQKAKEQTVGTTSELDGIIRMPLRYTLLLWKKAVQGKDPLFQAAFICSLVTTGYMMWKAPHVWKFLAKGGGGM